MRPSLLALTCVAALSVGCATGSGEEGGGVYSAVVQRLALESDLDQSRLTVREQNGVVSIGGFVNTLQERQALERAAAEIRNMDDVRRVDVGVSMVAGD